MYEVHATYRWAVTHTACPWRIVCVDADTNTLSGTSAVMRRCTRTRCVVCGVLWYVEESQSRGGYAPLPSCTWASISEYVYECSEPSRESNRFSVKHCGSSSNPRWLQNNMLVQKNLSLNFKTISENFFFKINFF